MPWLDRSDVTFAIRAMVPRPDAPAPAAEVIPIHPVAPAPDPTREPPFDTALESGPAPAPRDRSAERAERLARLRAALPSATTTPVATLEAAAPEAHPEARPETHPEAPRAGTPAEREARDMLDGLDRLRGVGPGLAWALRRAGLTDLAEIAALEAPALALRLGPIGRLVPAAAWIATARAALAPPR